MRSEEKKSFFDRLGIDPIEYYEAMETIEKRRKLLDRFSPMNKDKLMSEAIQSALEVDKLQDVCRFQHKNALEADEERSKGYRRIGVFMLLVGFILGYFVSYMVGPTRDECVRMIRGDQ